MGHIVIQRNISHRKEGNADICNNIPDLRGIMLNETSQRETNTVQIHLYVGSEKMKLIETENRLVVDRGEVWVVGEIDESGQKIQTSGYKIIKSRGWIYIHTHIHL